MQILLLSVSVIGRSDTLLLLNTVNLAINSSNLMSSLSSPINRTASKPPAPGTEQYPTSGTS